MTLFANSYPSFSNTEIKNIEKHSGNIAKNRILDYNKTIKFMKYYTQDEQLKKINFYLNQLMPRVDMMNQEMSDYWATPKEFLTFGYGDCEDYAIIKYFTLLKLGFEKDKLFITTVKEKFTGSYHMVLSYFEHKDKSPLILDNLSFRILDLESREDLQANTFINFSGVYVLDKNKKLVKTTDRSKKFTNLISKVLKED